MGIADTWTATATSVCIDDVDWTAGVPGPGDDAIFPGTIALAAIYDTASTTIGQLALTEAPGAPALTLVQNGGNDTLLEVACFAARTRLATPRGAVAVERLRPGDLVCLANGGAVVMAHPDFARGVWDRHGCAPLVLGGPILDLVQRRLFAQAIALGYRLSAEPPPGEFVDPASIAEDTRLWLSPEPLSHRSASSPPKAAGSR